MAMVQAMAQVKALAMAQVKAQAMNQAMPQVVVKAMVKTYILFQLIEVVQKSCLVRQVHNIKIIDFIRPVIHLYFLMNQDLVIKVKYLKFVVYFDFIDYYHSLNN